MTTPSTEQASAKKKIKRKALTSNLKVELRTKLEMFERSDEQELDFGFDLNRFKSHSFMIQEARRLRLEINYIEEDADGRLVVTRAQDHQGLTKGKSKNATLSMKSQRVVKIKLKQFQKSGDRELDFGVGINPDAYAFIRSQAHLLGLDVNYIGPASDRRLMVTRPADDLRLTEATKNSIKRFVDLHPISEDDIDRHIREAQSGSNQRTTNRGTSTATWGLIPPRSNPSPAVSAQRSELPAFKYKEKVIAAIEKNTVTLVTGGTGCGKTTQVPQFLLERAREKNIPLRIICTQPRRLPAIAVAERVAQERGEKVGRTVGYHIRLEKRTSPDTVLTYCTSGVLMRMLTDENAAIAYSHIILDEVHERETNTDYLLIALRQALKKRNDLKVILMSATMEGNQELFMDYFKDSKIAHVDISARRFTVDNFMLSEVIALTGYTGPNIKNAKTNSTAPRLPSASTPRENRDAQSNECTVADDSDFEVLEDDDVDVAEHLAMLHMNDGPCTLQAGGKAVKSAGAKKTKKGRGGTPEKKPESKKPKADSAKKTKENGENDGNTEEEPESGKLTIPHRPQQFVKRAVALVRNADLDHKAIVEKYLKEIGKSNGSVDMDLALAVVKYIMDSPVSGAILVFLPGLEDILTLWALIEGVKWKMDSPKPTICMLHSQLDPVEQRRVFEPVGMGRRKVILSTNIAEASLTIDDVVFVVDCGLVKENVVSLVRAKNAKKGDVGIISQLKTIWISKSNAEQRSGRAGRVRAGYCFRLFSHEEQEAMRTTQIAEMHRSPLHDVCLHAKMFETGMPVKEFLAIAPEPPTPESIDDSLRFLEQLGAVHWEEGRPAIEKQAKLPEPELTELGRLMARLPMEPQLARLLLFGYSLRCLTPIVTLVAILSHRDPFTIVINHQYEADNDAASGDFARRTFSQGKVNRDRDGFARRDFSDHVMLMRAFHEWTQQPQFYKAKWCHQHSLAPSAMWMAAGIRRQLLEELVRLGFIRDAAKALEDPTLNEHSKSWAMVQAAIVAGSHPHIGYIEKGPFREIKTSCGSKVSLHPASVLGRQTSEKTEDGPIFEFVAFQEHIRNGAGKLKLRMVTAVPSVTVALLGGPIRLPKEQLRKFCLPDEEDAELEVDYDDAVEMGLESWQPELGDLIQLRFKIMDHFLTVLQTPSLITSNNKKTKKLLSLLADVLEAEHEIKGIKEVTEFGTHSDSTDPASRPQMFYAIGGGAGGGKGGGRGGCRGGGEGVASEGGMGGNRGGHQHNAAEYTAKAVCGGARRGK